MTAPAPREGARRALHVATGALGLAAAKEPRLGTAFLAPIVLAAVILEFARFRSARARAAILALAGGYFRPQEAYAPSGASLLVAGYLVTWLLFPPLVAAAAITVAAVADPAAALVGRRWGTPGGKSAAGTGAAFGAALLVLLAWRTALPAALLAAAAAALVERVPVPGADNVAIPLATAAVLRFA